MVGVVERTTPAPNLLLEEVRKVRSYAVLMVLGETIVSKHRRNGLLLVLADAWLADWKATVKAGAAGTLDADETARSLEVKLLALETMGQWPHVHR